jgi:elongation factor Ts
LFSLLDYAFRDAALDAPLNASHPHLDVVNMLRRASSSIIVHARRMQMSPSIAMFTLTPNARALASKTSKMDLIKNLRERTGAPIVDVKAALTAHDYDSEAAYDALRAKGLAAAAKKAGRTSADGAVAALSGDRGVVLFEVNSETDFVARGESFQSLIKECAEATLRAVESDRAMTEEHGTATAGALRALRDERIGELLTSDGKPLSDAVRDVAVHVRENVRLRRAFAYAATVGAGEVIGTYVHGALAPGVGKQAACVVAKGVSEEFANKLAMHVVASSPLYLRSDCVPTDVMERELAVFRTQTEGSGKPANIVEKILAGRMNKYYEEVCLENQKFILDDSMTVEKAVKAEGGELVAFSRVKVGEGIEVEEKDFAAEVAEAVRTT